MNARSLISSAAVSLGVSSAMLGLGCHAESAPEEPLGESTSALSEGETERLRILTWNVGDTSDVDAVEQQASLVRAHAEGFDVVLLNEVFDGDARHYWHQGLSAQFPYVLFEIDGTGIDLEDSGLMVFSRLPFVPASFPDGASPQTGVVKLAAPGEFHDEVDQNGGIEAYARFDEFRSGVGDDATTAKGAVLFHVQAGTKRYNIVATNMQSNPQWFSEDPAPARATRIEQLEDIAWLMNARINPDRDDETIVAGDLGVDAIGTTGTSPVDLDDPSSFPAGDYRDRVWGDLHGEPFFDAWRTTSSGDIGLTETDPQESGFGRRTDYFLVRGSRYHSPGAATWASSAPFDAATGDPRCPNWVRTTLRAAGSDHAGLALEMGPRSPHCNPRTAAPGREDGVATTMQLAAPGANAWLHFPNKGTYTLGLDEHDAANGLSYEVFLEDDLSNNVSPLPKHDNVIELEGSDCGHRPLCSFKTSRFSSGDKGFFVRIFSPKGTTFGELNFFSLRHDCSSEATACELHPAEPLFTPNMPTNQDFVGHFTFSSLRTINETVPQTLTFDVIATGGEVSLESSRDGAPLGTINLEPEIRVSFPEAKRAGYLLKVARSAHNVTYGVAAKTNLTWVSAAPWLGCVREDGLNVGEEEINVSIYADDRIVAISSTWPGMFRDDLDEGENMDLSGVPGFGFVDQAIIRIDELDGDLPTDNVDDTTAFQFPKVPPTFGGIENSQRYLRLFDLVDGVTPGPLMLFKYQLSHGLRR